MFSELLENRIFSAEYLKTDLSSVLSITLQSSPEEIGKALERASPQNEDYDNIIIKEGETLKGYIPREELKNYKGNLANLPYYKFEKYSFNAAETIESVIKIINEDMNKSGTPRIYLIYKEDKQTGIMTYADLNRRSVYIYNYIIISFVEQWLRIRIAQNFKGKYRKLSNNWMNSLKTERRGKLLEWSKDKKESTLSVASIDDLIHVFKNEPRLKDLRKEFNKTLSNNVLANILFIRPKVMHPTKLLIPKNNINKGFKRMLTISKLSSEFIPYEDFNEKNHGWASV